MSISKASLKKAAEKGYLQHNQVDPLYIFLNGARIHSPRFDFTHVLYYFGGLIAIGALSLFMNLGWEQFGGWGIVSICCLYAVAGLLLTHFFQNRKHLIPAGICAAFVVVLVPLGIYGFQQAMGWWPDQSVYRDYHRTIQFLWIYMELGTLLAGTLMIWKYRYPFLLMPVAVTLWYMSMDITELFLGPEFSFRERGEVTMWFGLVMTLLAFWVDVCSRSQLLQGRDYGFWLYIFGVLTFWGGMTSQESNTELGKFLYFCVNIVLIGIGAIVVQRVFVVFGVLGCCGYLGHLSYDVFKDSWVFPVALTVIGLAVIVLGIYWQKHEEVITWRLRSILPQSVRDMLESR